MYETDKTTMCIWLFSFVFWERLMIYLTFGMLVSAENGKLQFRQVQEVVGVQFINWFSSLSAESRYNIGNWLFLET